MNQQILRNTLSQQTKKEIENPNRPITSKEITPAIGKLPTRKVQNQMALQMNSTKHLKHN